MTESSVQGRYRALRALATDQAGKPEGETARSIADRMLASMPSLGRGDASEPSRERREFRWSTETDRSVLLWCFDFVGVDVLHYTNSRKKVLLGDAAPALLDGVEQAYEATKPQAAEIVKWSLLGFLDGCMPRELSEDSGRTEASIDEDILATAIAAKEAGHSRMVRKAITAGGPRT